MRKVSTGCAGPRTHAPSTVQHANKQCGAVNSGAAQGAGCRRFADQAQSSAAVRRRVRPAAGKMSISLLLQCSKSFAPLADLARSQT